MKRNGNGAKFFTPREVVRTVGNILTGGEIEGKDAVIDSLKPGGRCGIVLDEGVLFRTNEQASACPPTHS